MSCRLPPVVPSYQQRGCYPISTKTWDLEFNISITYEFEFVPSSIIGIDGSNLPKLSLYQSKGNDWFSDSLSKLLGFREQIDDNVPVKRGATI